MLSQAFLPPMEISAVVSIPIRLIRPNPMQPRRSFQQQELQELADSIRSFGILQPLSVREVAGGYELVMGERRFRAAKLAGLTEVPCIVSEMREDVAAVCAIIENIQRKDLNCFEEAEAIQKLMQVYRFTQAEVAQKLGRSQSAIANKLRLLRISPPMRERLLNARLTERHARALLMLDTDDERNRALERIISQQLNVEAAEQMIKEQNKPAGKLKKPLRKYIIKDLRLFWNTVDKAVDTVQRAGIKVRVKKRTGEGYRAYYIIVRQ